MSVRRERKREDVGSVGIHSGLEACERGEGKDGWGSGNEEGRKKKRGRERRTLKLKNDFSIFPSFEVSRSSLTSVGAPNCTTQKKETPLSDQLEFDERKGKRERERDASSKLTFTFPFLLKSNTAKLHTYPTPST